MHSRGREPDVASPPCLVLLSWRVSAVRSVGTSRVLVEFSRVLVDRGIPILETVLETGFRNQFKASTF